MRESEKDPTLNEMLENMGVNQEQAVDAEFVPEEQIAEDVPPERNERLRMPIALAIGGIVSLPIAFLLFTTGGKVAQSPKDTAGTSTVASSPDSAAAAKEKELEQARTALFLESQKEKEKEKGEAKQPTPSPTVSVNPAPPASSKPVATKPAATQEEDGASQKIKKLEAQIARLEQSLSQKQTTTVARAPQIAKATPVTSIKPKPASSPTPTPSTQIAKSLASPSATAPITKIEPKAEKKANWEEIAAASSYGGEEEIKASPSSGGSETVAAAGTMRLPVGVSVVGHTAGPLAMLVGTNQNVQQDKAGQVLSVAIEQAIQVTGGWSIPAGSVIEFAINANESGLVQGISRKVFIGNDEVKIPAGAFGLSTASGEPLMASISQPNRNEMADADTKGAVWGGLTEVGKALGRAGDTNTTSNSGLGSTTTTINNPNPNIIGAGASGVFGVLSKRNTDRAEVLNKRLEKQGLIASLPANTKVQIFVLQAASFSPPGGYAEASAPPPAPPTAAESDVTNMISTKQRQMATTLQPIRETP